MSHGLEAILRPRAVAIVGASRDPAKRGHQAVRALLEGGYEGGIHPVHPAGGELFGLPVAPSILDLPGVPDLALLCTGSESAPDLIERCGAVGIRGAVVLAVGFRESGREGEALEDRIVSTARRCGVRLVGPNTSGILNPALGLNLVGVPRVPAGSLAVLSQSGNVGLDIMTRARAEETGLSLYVGVGNESEIAFHEYLEYLEADAATRAIMIYAEGFRDGPAFLEAADRVNASKPIAVLKGGRTEDGRVAARSHTGAVAGSHAVLSALLRERGIEVVQRSDEFLPIAVTLQSPCRIEEGKGVVVLADGGGHATLAVDLLGEMGLRLGHLSEGAQADLRKLLGPAAATGNPVDLAGAADREPRIFEAASSILLSEVDVGGILLTGLFGGYAIRFDGSLADEETRAADRLAATCADAGVPLLVHTLYATSESEPLRRLRARGVPVLASLETACRCASAARSSGSVRATVDRASVVLRSASPRPEADAGRSLPETVARDLVAGCGVPVVAGRFCRTVDEAIQAAGELDGPLVMKVVSPVILHKTDAGGVALGLEGTEAVAAAFERMREASAVHARSRRIQDAMAGVLLSPQLPRPVAELFVAARRDPQYGPIVVAGEGGVGVELAADVTIRGLPLRGDGAAEMFHELRIWPILSGFRGHPGVALEVLAEIVRGAGDCLLADPVLDTVELNPVFAYEDGAVAVDVLVLRRDIDLNSTARG